MNRIRQVVLLGAAIVLMGCYHAKIETGLPASNDTIEKAWAAGFVYGLVPPAAVETAEDCPTGVARVETKLSFLNQLVSGLTFGIFTPMHITVTCAAPGRMDAEGVEAQEVQTDKVGTVEGHQRAIGLAAEKARESGKPVFVRFD